MILDQSLPFGTLLRRHRLAAVLSQEALAERAGLSPSAVTALERGYRTAPRPDTVTLLADALQLAPPERTALIAAAVAARAPASDPPSVLVAPSDARTGPFPPLLIPPTPLIGREREAASITHLLKHKSGACLVTLTGPGGVGKTRLALAVASALETAYADGVIFVDLSPLRDPALVATTIGQALGLRELGAATLPVQIIAHLQHRRTLLVLDNIEHLLAAAPLIADLVAGCMHLAVLATSRVALRLRAEQRVRVRPLDTPDAEPASWEDVGRIAAVRLFVERARALRPDFTLDAQTTSAVAAICRKLDGLPLAIELAAARITLLPPAALLERLEQRLAVLKGGARDLPARQQTLRATINWSYALLTPWERALFRRLSVFAGGFSLEAAETLAATFDTEGGDIFAGIEQLVDHSLLHSASQADGTPRLRMLETIREYGLEQLAEYGEALAARQAHTTYFLDLAETANARLFGSEQVQCIEMLEREHDNLREVLSGAREHGRPQHGLRLAGLLWRFWYLRCHLSEGRGWLLAFVSQPGDQDSAQSDRLDALVGLAVIAYAQTDYPQAALAAEEAMTLARALNHSPNLALSLNILGGVARHRSDFGRAAALGEEAVALTRSMGDRWSLALSLNNLAEVARFQGAYTRATALATESLGLSRAIEDRWGVAQALLTLGRIDRDHGDNPGAWALFTESLAIVRELGHTRDIALALAGLGYVAHAQGDRPTAIARLEESLALLRRIGDRLREAEVLTALGRTYHAQGDLVRASSLLAECLAAFQALENRLGVAECLEAYASIALPNDAERAVQLLATAAALREAIASPRPPVEAADHHRTLSTLRTTLGPVRFDAAWAAGSALSSEQAIKPGITAC